MPYTEFVFKISFEPHKVCSEKVRMSCLLSCRQLFSSIPLHVYHHYLIIGCKYILQGIIIYQDFFPPPWRGSRLKSDDLTVIPLSDDRHSTVIPLLPKATFTPIQPNLCVPSTRPPLSSYINNLLAIRYSPILSTCPNHLNTL